MSFQEFLIEKRNKNMKLPSLVKYYQSQFNPLLDEQICLAHVLNLMKKLNLKVTKKEIYYCFKKNYKKEFHGDVQSYVTWLYSLSQPSSEKANSSISDSNKTHSALTLNETSNSTTNSSLCQEMAYIPHISTVGGDLK